MPKAQIFDLANKATGQQSKRQISTLLNSGHVGVLPTDTIYGLVGTALKREVVEKIYSVKKRRPEKPFIILISSIKDLKKFGVEISSSANKFLSQVWPGKISVILPCPGKELEYLHRGTFSLAFRLPDNKFLRSLIKTTGPLVAPSANPEGFNPATNLKEAQSYFGEKIDFYVNFGEIKGEPSDLVKIDGSNITLLRGKMPKTA